MMEEGGTSFGTVEMDYEQMKYDQSIDSSISVNDANVHQASQEALHSNGSDASNETVEVDGTAPGLDALTDSNQAIEDQVSGPINSNSTNTNTDDNPNDLSGKDLDSESIPQDEPDSETAAEERHVREKRVATTQDATTKLEQTLRRLRDVTNTMLDEMKDYLETAEDVEVDYIKCQYSQRQEARRLDEVAPDINGTTASLV